MTESRQDIPARAKRRPGELKKVDPKIDATPERIARSFFAAAKRPDPSLRKPRRKAKA